MFNDKRRIKEGLKYFMDQKFTILLVEDEQFLSDIYSEALKKADFLVERAFDGEEALKKVKDKAPSLVLLDLIIPLKDGFIVLEEIKNNPVSKDIPVIICSNLGQESDIEKCKELGACEYLIKADVPLHEMVMLVRKTLN